MELSLNEQQLLRRQSLEQLRAMGIDPYPAALFPVNTTAEEIKSEFPENPDKFKQKNIIFSDMFLQIKLATSKERIDIISKMIKHFEILEEYEKCSVLKKDFIDTTY